jgi:SAM-dependent methyltransferase
MVAKTFRRIFPRGPARARLIHMTNQPVENVLKSLALRYPEPFIKGELEDVPRISFHIELIRGATSENAVIADIGGGVGLLSLGCAALGMKVTLVDDFRDSVNLSNGDVFRLHREYDIRVESRDVTQGALGFPSASFDAISCIDSMEHWHSSPKRLFHELIAALKPGGLFLLGVPNCVDLMKRISVPLGKGKWTNLDDWYEPEVFRGHVREPDVDDLRRISRDLGLADVRILGRNWAGYYHRVPLVRLLMPLADRILRLRPSLCSDIYMLGHKPR